MTAERLIPILGCTPIAIWIVAVLLRGGAKQRLGVYLGGRWTPNPMALNLSFLGVLIGTITVNAFPDSWVAKPANACAWACAGLTFAIAIWNSLRRR